jgi:hypothetical protein
VRAIDFAGLLRVSPNIELEISPKFLGASAAWREDFFFLAMLSRHGALLSTDRLNALTSASVDLDTLVARAIIQMFWDQHRLPIRTYRRNKISSFAIDGEAEAEDIVLPSDDGFDQTVVQLVRHNEFNAAIKAAITHLLLCVSNSEVRSNLQRVVERLGDQKSVRIARPQRLPTRFRNWQSTYDLAIDVLQGFGIAYGDGAARAPGYVLETWRAWEDLVTISLSAKLGGHAVAAQRGFILGQRHRNTEDDGPLVRSLRVTPDLQVKVLGDGFGAVLVDAKYKGRVETGRQRIGEADVYESLAFARAAKSTQVILVYPKVADGSSVSPVGTASVFERVVVDETQIWGLEIEVRGISGSGGVLKFADGLISQFRSVAENAVA